MTSTELKERLEVFRKDKGYITDDDIAAIVKKLTAHLQPTQLIQLSDFVFFKKENYRKLDTKHHFVYPFTLIYINDETGEIEYSCKGTELQVRSIISQICDKRYKRIKNKWVTKQDYTRILLHKVGK